MFMLVAIPIGVVVGLLVGGDAGRLGRVRFRWAWLAIAGLLLQVALFTEAGDSLFGPFAAPAYVLSTAAVFAAVVANLRLDGMIAVAIGAACNLAAISANGGRMPADPGALRLAGFDGPGTHTNSAVLADPALRPLTDVYAIPAGVPFANVFSVGDVLIGLGIVAVIVLAMRRSDAAPVEAATAAD